MESLAREKMHFVVAKEIEKYILENNLKGGDQLPSEMQLTKILKIGRSSVREGVRLLEGMGMIYVQHGKGIFVETTKKAKISIEVGTDKKSFLDVLEIRKILEAQAVTLAIKKGTDRDIEKISNAFRIMKQKHEMGEKADVLDYDFHIAIYEASHNLYLKTLIESISYIFLHAWKESISVPSVFNATFIYHEHLTNAIINKNVEEAVEAIKIIVEHSETAINDCIEE